MKAFNFLVIFCLTGVWGYLIKSTTKKLCSRPKIFMFQPFNAKDYALSEVLKQRLFDRLTRPKEMEKDQAVIAVDPLPPTSSVDSAPTAAG